MKGNTPLLSIKNLKIHFRTYYGTVKAIDNVSFDIHQGETFGLLGETGCGKSVTSLAIMGLLEENASIKGGEIIFKGKDLLKKSEEEFQKIRGKEISRVFQDPSTSLNPLIKVKDQLMTVLKANRDLKEEARKEEAKRLLRELRLNPNKVMKAYPFQLSGGMQQRVMLAIALACEPTLLIADEPTSSLDVTIQAKILDLMGEIQKKRNLSILYITHNLGVVAEFADTAGIIHAGQMIEIAPVDEVLENPLHPYTRGLLNAVPSPREKKQLQSIKGSIPDATDPPSGCRFHPRCTEKMDVCPKARPKLKEAQEGHLVACYLYDS